MVRQYGAQRYKGGSLAHLRIGTVPIGTILYLQDHIDRYRGPVCRNPWIVEAWLNREYYPCTPTRPRTTYMRGGHLAVVRSLRDGRRQRVSDAIVLQAYDLDLIKQ